MPKVNSLQSLQPIWRHHHQQSNQLKFDLYVKVQEVETVLSTLKDLRLLSNQDQRSWLEDNEPMVMEMLEQFLDNSVTAMSGFQLDKESMELSMKLMTDLREATTIIQSFYDDEPTVVS